MNIDMDRRRIHLLGSGRIELTTHTFDYLTKHAVFGQPGVACDKELRAVRAGPAFAMESMPGLSWRRLGWNSSAKR
jgi:hypothetical protein